jgi:diguanylate cyclase (GGDEF)-like protein
MADCQGGGGASPEPVTVEAAILDASGSPVPFELTFVDMGRDPTVSGVVVSAHNITKLRAYQKALADLARTDPLTRLPNRTAADETLTDLLERRDRVAVAFVDLDDFKALNDRHGHHFGDQVLVAVAERLRSTVRPTDLVARYGGDEFVVIVHNPAEGAALDERLSKAMCRPISIGALEVVVKASVGVTYTRPSDALTAVLIRADRAMYGSKGGRTQLGAVAGS